MTDSHLAGTGSRPCASFWGSGCRPGASSASGGGCPAPPRPAPRFSRLCRARRAPFSRPLEGITALGGGGTYPAPRFLPCTSPSRRPLRNAKHKRNRDTVPARSICGLASWKWHRFGSNKLGTIPNSQHTPISTRARKRLSSPSFPGRQARPAPAAVTALPGHPGLR